MGIFLLWFGVSFLIANYIQLYENQAPEILSKRYYYKNNNAYYTILVDFGDEVCLLREDVNTKILMKRVDFEKFLKEVEHGN